MYTCTYDLLLFKTFLQNINKLEKENRTLLLHRDNLRRTKNSLLFEFRKKGCLPSNRICSCGIRVDSARKVSASETRSPNRDDTTPQSESRYQDVGLKDGTTPQSGSRYMHVHVVLKDDSTPQEKSSYQHVGLKDNTTNQSMWRYQHVGLKDGTTPQEKSSYQHVGLKDGTTPQ